MTKKNNISGFTLIELLVVISLIILFSGLSLAAYNNFNEERKLDEEASKLVDVLSLAGKKSAAGETDSSYCTGTFHGYITKLNPQANSYRLAQCCNIADPENCKDSQNTKLVQTYSLASNYVVTVSPPGNINILFRVLGRGTNLSGKTTITIENTKVNKCIDIDIERSGLVTSKVRYAC
ncbi:prepilin-type N-terminal cleavage/methylation domain-containing protein [Candidatus Roizmanbacteria bacterium]|nr:prepilin-type N-terminal cleavage/methylation domain-containing protein [Candidatus Roizmanbacteria bacterium]